MACFAGVTKWIAFVGLLSLPVVSHAETGIGPDTVAVSTAQAKAFEYVDKTKGQCLSSLFDGNKFDCPSNSSVVSVLSYVMSDEQCSKNKGVSVPLSQWKETPRPDVRGMDDVFGDLGPVEKALDILGKLPSGLKACAAIGATGCSLPQLEKNKVEVVVKQIMPFDIAGECVPDWGIFGQFKGFEISLPEFVSNRPVDGAYVLAHELTHSLQMKSYHRIAKKNNIDANRFYMEVDAKLTEIAVAHELRMKGLLADVTEMNEIVFISDMCWQFWDAKRRFSPVPPSMASLGLDPKWSGQYNKAFDAYNTTKNSNSFLSEIIGRLVHYYYGASVNREDTGDATFRSYVKGRIREMDRKWRDEDNRLEQIYNCHKNDDTSGRVARANMCDFSLEPWSVRMANLQMAAEDACSMYGRARATRVTRSDYGDMVAAQFRVAGLSLDVNSRLAVADRFEPDSCPYNLIRMTNLYSAFGVMNEYTLRHFIHDGFDFPDNDSGSSNESGDDSAGNDSSGDDGGSDSGDDGSSNGWDSGHDYDPHFQPGI